MIFQILAWIGFFGAVLTLAVGPYVIGKPREPWTPGVYLFRAGFEIITITLAGRVLGWW